MILNIGKADFTTMYIGENDLTTKNTIKLQIPLSIKGSHNTGKDDFIESKEWTRGLELLLQADLEGISKAVLDETCKVGLVGKTNKGASDERKTYRVVLAVRMIKEGLGAKKICKDDLEERMIYREDSDATSRDDLEEKRIFKVDLDEKTIKDDLDAKRLKDALVVTRSPMMRNRDVSDAKIETTS